MPSLNIRKFDGMVLFAGLPASFHYAVFLNFYEGRTLTLLILFQDCRLRRLPKLLRGVYSNPFNKMLRISLCFLMLINLRERAPDVASH